MEVRFDDDFQGGHVGWADRKKEAFLNKGEYLFLGGTYN